LSSGRFYNPRETIYDFINVNQPGSETGDLLSWIYSRTPGLPEFYTYFIDEVQTGPSRISTIAIPNVAMIKVQGRGKTHQIFIYLKRGGETVNKNPSLSIEKIPGYDHQEIYKSPEYSLAESSRIKIDNRDLLYWSSNISSDQNNQKYKLQFFNSDKAKNTD